MLDTVHIGKAAKLAGVSVDTIRFYQKVGLIKGAGRTGSGYRLFDEEQIRDLRFVCHALELGFSPRSQGPSGVAAKGSCLFRSAGHAGGQADVREKIKNLARLEAELAAALRNCNRELRLQREVKHEDCCPLLTKLDRMNGSNGNEDVESRREPSNK